MVSVDCVGRAGTRVSGVTCSITLLCTYILSVEFCCSTGLGLCAGLLDGEEFKKLASRDCERNQIRVKFEHGVDD
jgi:hypothetical protein